MNKKILFIIAVVLAIAVFAVAQSPSLGDDSSKDNSDEPSYLEIELNDLIEWGIKNG